MSVQRIGAAHGARSTDGGLLRPSETRQRAGGGRPAVPGPSGARADAQPVPVCPLDGVPVARLDRRATLDRIAHWLAAGHPRRVATANLDFLRLARRDRALRAALATADLVTADGWPLVALSRLTDAPIPERVAGSDLVPALLERCAREGRSVYFLGATEPVMARALDRIRCAHPRLAIAGHASPFVDWDDSLAAGAVADDVRASGADLLLVALGCPRQDLFLARHLARTGAAVGIGIGGTLDFLAGERRRSPRPLQALGLEWLVRLAQEPRRLAGRYLADLVHLAHLTRTTRAAARRARRGSLLPREPFAPSSPHRLPR